MAKLRLDKNFFANAQIFYKSISAWASPHTPHRPPSSPYLQKGLERGTVKAKAVKGQSREVFKRGNLSL